MRRWTASREYLQNAGTVAFYAVYGSLVLLLLEQVVTDPTTLQESLAVGASVVGELARFVLLRNWVFGGRDEGAAAGVGHSGGVTRLRRLLVPLAASAGLLLATAGACDTPAAPSAPPATVEPSADSSDDLGRLRGRRRRGHGRRDRGRRRGRRGPGDSGDPSRGADDGGLSGGNTGESR